MARTARAGTRDSRAVVRRPDPEQDRPRWALLAPIAVVALAAGVLWPRACGLRSEGPGEEATTTVASGEPAASVEAPPVATTDAAPPPAIDAGPEAPVLANVLVGKSTLMRCQDPPAAELKPSKCGEPGLDPNVVPRIEQLATCPAAAGVSGKLALTVDLDFKKQVARVIAGKGSAIRKNGHRDDKAIEPLLACVRTALKEVVGAGAEAPAHDHQRYVLAYPVTITEVAAAAPPAPAPEKLEKVPNEKATSGVATVQVDTAIVRDAPSTSGQPIGRLSRGTKVKTVGTAANWFHIRFGEDDAQEGWIFRTNIGK